MYKQLGFVDLISAIQTKVEENTGLKCYDEVPLNAESPFYFAEAVRKRPAHSKTMWRDVFTVWLHAIAKSEDGSKSSVGVYELIQKAEEALTDDIELSEDYELIMQTNNGIQTIKTDETGEKHAVLEYDFTVCYGFKCKI